MTKYDSEFLDPPAPVAYVVLRNPVTGSEVANVPMLLDTGADVSLIPQRYAEQLAMEVQPETQYEIVAYDGSRRALGGADVDMVFNGKLFKGRFLVRDDPVGIIGRNILNQLYITLDGRALMWDVEFR